MRMITGPVWFVGFALGSRDRIPTSVHFASGVDFMLGHRTGLDPRLATRYTMDEF